MKDFYKKNTDKIWYLLCVLAVSLGMFVDVVYGFFVVLLIGLHFYIELGSDRSFTEFDRFEASFAALLFHIIVYFGIIALVSSVIDKEEIKESNSYEVKFLENEKIVINTGDNLEIIDNARLYWECTAKNCKNIIITIIEEKPVTNVFSSDLFYKTNIEYSVD